MRLQGKVTVITGAGSGMGLAMATLFAAEGASVVAGDWNGERLEAAVANIKQSGGTIIGAQGNIADQATAEHLIDLAISTYGQLDVLCNNAGVMDYMQGVARNCQNYFASIDPVYNVSIRLPLLPAHSGRAPSRLRSQGPGAKGDFE